MVFIQHPGFPVMRDKWKARIVRLTHRNEYRLFFWAIQRFICNCQTCR